MTVLTNTLRTVRDNFTPLRYPNFRLYLGGQAISLIGTWLQSTAQSWVVWELTGSEAALGIVSMLNALPILFFGAFAGVWIDRVDRRKLLIGTQVMSMILAFLLAILVQTNTIQVWHIYLMSFLLGTANALDFPAQQTFLGDLAGMADVRKAVNLNITIVQVSRILGPAFAGMIVARLGVAPAFWLNGLSFVAVIISLILVKATQHINKARPEVGPLRQIAEGISHLRTAPRLQDLFLVSILLTFFVFSVIINVLPAVADKLLDGNAETLGLLMASSGFGALISVLIIVPIVQSFKRNGRVMIIALFWIAAWLTVFAHSRSVTLSMLALCMGSMGAPTVMTVALGLVQLMSPPEMRGRLISLYTTISFGLQPLAALWIGQTAEIIGVETAIQLNAILLALGAGAMIIFRPTIMIYEYGTAKHEDVRYDAPDKPAVTSPTASPTTVVTDGPVLP